MRTTLPGPRPRPQNRKRTRSPRPRGPPQTPGSGLHAANGMPETPGGPAGGGSNGRSPLGSHRTSAGRPILNVEGVHFIEVCWALFERYQRPYLVEDTAKMKLEPAHAKPESVFKSEQSHMKSELSHVKSELFLKSELPEQSA